MMLMFAKLIVRMSSWMLWSTLIFGGDGTPYFPMLHPQKSSQHVRACAALDGAICPINGKIVPYHRCARIPRLTVSVPDYGSCFYRYSISLTKFYRLLWNIIDYRFYRLTTLGPMCNCSSLYRIDLSSHYIFHFVVQFGQMRSVSSPGCYLTL